MNEIIAVPRNESGEDIAATAAPSCARGYASRWIGWVTPKYWLRRHYRTPIAIESNRLLPRPFDPATVAYELRHEADPKALEAGKLCGEPMGDAGATGIDEIVSRAIEERRSSMLAAGALGLTTGIDFLQGFAEVDDRVLHAASDLFNQRIDSIGDLAHRLDAATLGQGLTSALKGRMAEHVLTSHLSDLGVNVVLAESPNQIGWDLTIDGVAVNPKLYADATDVAHHFARFPDIPVILPGDSLHIPPDALHFDSLTGAGLENIRESLAHGGDHLTFVDDALSHADLGRHASDALEASAHPTSSVHFHLPWVAIALSGWREARLLVDGHTEVGTSIKNASLDVAGTGVGGFAGAKGGALLGALFGPIGAAVGAVFGGIAGAIGGRKITGHIKDIPLRDARENYYAAYGRLQSALSAQDQSIKRRMQDLQIYEQENLAAAAADAKERIDRAISNCAKERRSFLRLNSEEAAGLLLVAANSISAFRAELLARRAARSVWRRWLWPDVSLLACEQAIEVLDAALLRIEAWKVSVAAGRRLNRSEVFSFLGGVGFAETEIRADLARIEDVQRARDGAIQDMFREAMNHLLGLRSAAMERVKRALGEAVQDAQQSLKPYVTETSFARRDVEREARKLGHAI